MFLIKVILISCTLLHAIHSFRVIDWGVTSDINRLKCAFRDVFEETFDLVNAGQEDYPLPDIKKEYYHQWRNVTSIAEFRAFNGWLEAPRVQTSSSYGCLRRLVIPSNTSTWPWHHQREMIVCNECVSVVANSVNYAYEAYYNSNSKRVFGRITKKHIKFNVNSKITIVNEYGNESNYYCGTNAEPIVLSLDPYGVYNDTEIRGLRSLNFIQDHIDDWLQEHLNGTVRVDLESRLQIALAKVFSLHEICDEFLQS